MSAPIDIASAAVDLITLDGFAHGAETLVGHFWELGTESGDAADGL